MLTLDPIEPEPTPDPTAAQARLDAFVAENSAALMDGNDPAHRFVLKERARMYRQIYGDEPAEGLDISSSRDAAVVPVGDHAAAIERVISRYGGEGQEQTAFAGELAAAGISAAEMAPLAQEIASSSPMAEHELVARVGRHDLKAAGEYLAANPALDELIAERELWRFPVVLRELARRHREHK